MLYKNKVLLVCSPYYKEITDNLILGASKVLEANLNFWRIGDGLGS